MHLNLFLYKYCVYIHVRVYMHMYMCTYIYLSHLNCEKFLSSYQISLVSFLDSSYFPAISKLYLDKIVPPLGVILQILYLSFGFRPFSSITYVFISQHRLVKCLRSRYTNECFALTSSP